MGYFSAAGLRGTRTVGALTVGVLLCAFPASAQQVPPPAALPAAVAPAPVAVSAPVAVVAPLAIPAPPGGKLRVEMDARSEDLLGMMKAFLKGVGETGGLPRPKAPGQPAPPPNPVADLLQNGNLAEMLKDVNHVHFAVYEMPGPAMPPVFPLKPPVKKPGKPLPPIDPPRPAPLPAFDSNAYYENAFGAEGAHRLLFTDADQYKLVMVGFPDRRGFAFAVSGAGYVAVSRTDGYPNLEVLSAFISRATAAAINSKAGKTILDGAMNSDKPGGDKPEEKTDDGDSDKK